jgi:hypothetical protein
MTGVAAPFRMRSEDWWLKKVIHRQEEIKNKKLKIKNKRSEIGLVLAKKWLSNIFG